MHFLKLAVRRFFGVSKGEENFMGKFLYIAENGSEVYSMSKKEAKASVKEMERMMEYFEGICEYCGEKRMDCSAECIETKSSRNFV